MTAQVKLDAFGKLGISAEQLQKWARKSSSCRSPKI